MVNLIMCLELNMNVLQSMCSNCDLHIATFEGVILLIKKVPNARLFDQLYVKYELASPSVISNIRFLRTASQKSLFLAVFSVLHFCENGM